MRNSVEVVVFLDFTHAVHKKTKGTQIRV